MFVHGSQMHLVMNVIVQIFLGVTLELVHDWWRISLVYLSGVIAGSLGASITGPHRNLIGASGGVYALITAHIAAVILVNFIRILTFLFHFYKKLQFFLLLFNIKYRIGVKWTIRALC